MVDRCRDCGFDLAGGLVEVVPTAHYFMGGVICRTDTSTEWPGLFVAGEDASGMHGANRLGGNGVANSTVFGGIAGDVDAALDCRATRAIARARRASAGQRDVRARCIHSPARPAISTSCAKGCSTPCGTTSASCAIETGLDARYAALAAIETELLGTGIAEEDRAFNMTWHDWLNLRSLCEISRVIALAAGQREEFTRRAFPFRFPGTGRAGDLVVHGGAANAARSRDQRAAGRVHPRQAGREPARGQGSGRIGRGKHDSAFIHSAHGRGADGEGRHRDPGRLSRRLAQMRRYREGRPLRLRHQGDAGELRGGEGRSPRHVRRYRRAALVRQDRQRGEDRGRAGRARGGFAPRHRARDQRRAAAPQPRASALAHRSQQQCRHRRAGDRIRVPSRRRLDRAHHRAQGRLVRLRLPHAVSGRRHRRASSDSISIR